MNDEALVGLVIDDKYRLDRKLGEGGMGAVFLGTQLMVDRNVAIKLLHGSLSGHDRIKQRFEVEAKAIGRMHHPNCITLFDFGFSQTLDSFYMVMEYLDGLAMHKRVHKGVSVEEALSFTRQIALALDHAHHQGILHRDLKPENVMITKMTDGSELAKVLDFGIARIFSGEEEKKSPQEQNRLTKAGEVFGTPAYISPEQARGERELTPASDLYSLGIMLFEMLTGDLPFWGDTAIDTIMKHITAPVPAINRLDVPAELKQLTYDLLSKDPTKRPQSGKELVERLNLIEHERKQAALGAASSSSMNLPVMNPPSEPTAHATIPDMSRNELNEWAQAEATVVHSSPLTSPRIDPSFGAQPARAPQQTGPPAGRLPGRHPAMSGPQSFTTAPPVRPPAALSLDELEHATQPDLSSSSSRTRALPLVVVMLLVVGLGAALALFFTQDQQARGDALPTTEQAAKLEPKPTPAEERVEPEAPDTAPLEFAPPGAVEEEEVAPQTPSPTPQEQVEPRREEPRPTKKTRPATKKVEPKNGLDKLNPFEDDKKTDPKIRSLELDTSKPRNGTDSIPFL